MTLPFTFAEIILQKHVQQYSFVLLGFVSSFGNGETPPQLNLGDHCNPFSSSGCSTIATETKYCQQQGIKVMLSLGGVSTNYYLSSSDDALNLSDYLWNNFLGGSSSSSRPLGDAILDGIDFNIQTSIKHLEDLARYLQSHNTDSQKLYLSAAPECPFLDAFVGTALNTGLFDYVWVQFFENPPCAYSEANPNAFVNAWNQSATSLNGSKIFLGLTTSELAIGYIPADLLISKVLPTVKKSPNYGGVTLELRKHDSGFEERFGYMSTDSIKVYEGGDLGGQCCETICWNNCSCEAYDPVSGCHIWLKGTRFTDYAAGSKGLSIYIVRHKDMLCFSNLREAITFSCSAMHIDIFIY